MNKVLKLCPFCLIFLVLNSITAQSDPGFTPVKHILVIGVDGMSPDGIRQANTPNIDYLVANGASTFRARGVLPSSSSPNWASMIMGAGPEQHGITSNAWERDDFILPGAASGPGGYFPSIFTLVHDQRPAALSAAIYHWEGFGRLFDSTLVDLSISPPTEEATAEMAAACLLDKQPLMCFVHFDHVGASGSNFQYTGIDRNSWYLPILSGF